MVLASGSETLHIVLCNGMERCLRARYRGIKRSFVVSNAIFLTFSEHLDENVHRECRTIGFLSNLTAEKGVFEVLSLAERCQADGVSLRFDVAGPFLSRSVEQEFRRRASKLGNLQYYGPVYGDSKRKFFSNIDIFIFPTKYKNEAEPLVIHEALNAGCPVIAYERGCIGSVVSSECGFLVPREVEFVVPALRVIKEWQKDTESFMRARRAARRKWELLYEVGRRAENELFRVMRED
jgi:glycosyltransferase involved in cell wall biosynthesis